MSVLIKGMKMPKDKEVVLRIDSKGEVYIYGGYPTEIHEAVELPDHLAEGEIDKWWERNETVDVMGKLRAYESGKRSAEPKRGKWIDHTCINWHGYHCSVCDYETQRATNYCPNCGAKMEGGEDATD